jgi:hypothetical protein
MKRTNLKKFLKNVDTIFSRYTKDDVLDHYVYEDESEVPEIVVGLDDSIYVWAALDGMVQLWNELYKTNISFEQEDNEEAKIVSFTFMED